MGRYFEAHGEGDERLYEQLVEWVTNDEASAEIGERTEFLGFRAFVSHLDTGEPFLPAMTGCRVRLPDPEQPEPSVAKFGGVDHIGSGSEVAEYAAAVEKAQEENIGLVNLYMGMDANARADIGERVIARIVANSWANLVANTPTPGVSSDLDVCVITGVAPVIGTTIQNLGTQDAPHEALPIATTLDEFRRLASDELRSHPPGALVG
ncbi:MAG: hypothetical protein ACRDQ2_15135 [Gaiellales bacterium]